MQSRLVASQRFQRNISTFARAIHRGIFDLRHASVILKYWGRFGPTFDDFVRLLMHDLRDEGNYGNQGELVATVLVETLQGVSTSFVLSFLPLNSSPFTVRLGPRSLPRLFRFFR